MKVTCQSCQAKYTIADEKVRGKVAKIRCKKCGTTIIVNGTDGTGVGVSEPPQAGPAVADYTNQGASDEQWTVLVGDGDQRTLTAAEVSELYVTGTITYETPAWKDGMPEWIPISQIDALRSVLENGPRPTMTLVGATEPEAPTPFAPVAAVAPAAKKPGVVAPRAKAPEPAARRAGRGGAVDMFGAAAQEDVLTSASASPTPHAGGDDKLTGARNENSVLFSLSALTGGGMPGPAPSAARNDPTSSKADLRSLLGNNDSNGRGPPPPKNKLDDIMNLGGGGVYSPALMAPVLTAPSVDFSTVAADPTASDGKPKGKGLLFAIIGGVILIGGGVAFTMMGKGDATDKTSAGASATASLGAAPTATDTTPTTAKATPDPVATAAPAPTPEAAPTVIAPGQAAPKPEPAEHKATPKAAAEPKAAPAEPKAAPAAPAPESKPAPAAPAAGGSGDFDRAAALSALSSAATSAQSCRKADGPTGAGRIAVTFANNGSATTANVEGPPFAGTPVGGCVAARFRGAHVPPFGGAPVTVHKSFNIN